MLAKEQIVELQKLVRQVPVASHVKDYAVRLVLAHASENRNRRAHHQPVSALWQQSARRADALLGAKVRALAHGRFNVSFEDIQAVATAALRHRLILNFEAEAEGITTDHIIAQILKDVPKDAAAVEVVTGDASWRC